VEDSIMGTLLKLAIAFFVISLVAALFGFTGIAAGSAAAAKILFFVFLGLAILFVILGVLLFKAVT
jgi:uncharacterized membrane protein YtjA (UPF0391 family)